MCFIGRLSRGRRGVGSVIGATFLVLILLTGYMFYFLNIDVSADYSKTLEEMQELDQKRNKENIEYITVSFNQDDKLNITVRNIGSQQTHFIWLGIVDEAANTQRYYGIDFYVDPAETVSDIRNETMTTFEGEDRVIQLVTELGNVFTFPLESRAEYYFVDNDTSNKDDSDDKGVHSLFSAEQAGPDGIVDTLTEENTNGGTQDHTEYCDSQNLVTYKDYGADQYSGAESHTDTHVSDDKYFYFSSSDGGDLEVQLIYETTILKSDVFWIYLHSEHRWEDDISDIQVDIYDYDNSSWCTILTISYSGGDVVQTYNLTSSASEFISSEGQMQIRYYGTGTQGGKKTNLDYVYLQVRSKLPNYELDLEVQWQSIDSNEANEWLTIYGGTMGTEDILVDVWNGIAWINLFTDLSSGWNSVDVSSYLTSSTFTIRFLDTVDDDSQNMWEIDAAFLYVWS